MALLEAGDLLTDLIRTSFKLRSLVGSWGFKQGQGPNTSLGGRAERGGSGQMTTCVELPEVQLLPKERPLHDRWTPDLHGLA